MTELHARVDLLEGAIEGTLAGAARGLATRSFLVLRLMRDDGTTGIGEASPLPGYSPDTVRQAATGLQELASSPVLVDALASPYGLLQGVFSTHRIESPSARFALETALLDWLGKTRATPLHRLIAGDRPIDPLPIADLVREVDPERWPAEVDALIEAGATHLKVKIGADLDREVAALATIRRTHGDVPLRLDGNRRLTLDLLRTHAASLEALRLELLEEPVAAAHWDDALDLPLPFALDESLRDPELCARLYDSGRIRAVVLKPTVLGGLRACIAAAERAADHGAGYLVSHTFDGPIARAAAAELALALGGELAAGLGEHPALQLWPPEPIASIAGRRLVPHEEPGLGLSPEEPLDA